MNRTGSGPQPLRSTPGNVFANTQAVGSRVGALGPSRLQNGKIATGTSTWNFGAAGTPSLPAPQQRTTTSNPSSFAQSIGTSQSPLTPLDLSRTPHLPDDSEFPSLSGAPQSQPQNTASQAIWGNSGTRAPQSNQNRSINQTNPTSDPSHTIRPPSHTQSHRPLEALEHNRTSPFSQIRAPLEDFAFGNDAHAQITRENDRHGAQDEFPPLGGLGSRGLGHLRRTGFGQESHMNGTTNGDFGSPPLQSRSSISRQQEGLLGQGTSNDVLASPVSRSPLEGLNGESEILQSGDRSIDDRLSSNLSRIPFRGSQNGGQQHDRFGRPSQQSSSSIPSAPDSQHTDHAAFRTMTESEKYGIRGLQAILDGELGPDKASLAHGLDLNLLGLDLNRSSPLYTDWAGPFADPGGRLVIPEFTLPPAYTVHNVPPLHEKISSFSDETLFMIFYQNPRDESQEQAASELYQRDWRWHKKLQQWMMKAKEYGDPVQSQSRQEERGVYYFWNANEWRRDRREFILSYEHLHHAQPVAQAVP